MTLSMPVGFVAATENFAQGAERDLWQPYFDAGVLLSVDVTITDHESGAWNYESSIGLTIACPDSNEPLLLRGYAAIKAKEHLLPGVIDACYRFVTTLRDTYVLHDVLKKRMPYADQDNEVDLFILPSGYALCESQPYVTMEMDLQDAETAILAEDQEALKEFDTARLISILLEAPTNPSAHELMPLMDRAQTVFDEWSRVHTDFTTPSEDNPVFPFVAPLAKTIKKACE